MLKNSRPKVRSVKNINVRTIRERKCLVTGETYPAHKMIRFVVAPDGHVIPDVAAKLPGRGGWVLAQGTVLKVAMKKKIFTRFGYRALASIQEAAGRKLKDFDILDDLPEDPKLKIIVEDGLIDLVEKLLGKRCLDYLGFVNRAGLLVSGFEKVRANLGAHKCRVLLIAEDAAGNSQRKLCSGLGNVLDKLRVIDMFSREQLGQALGLSNAVHVALRSGEMTESFLAEFSRYESAVIL